MKNFVTLAQAEELLKLAARKYLSATEDDTVVLSSVIGAKEKLCEMAVLWAQTEAIETIERHHDT